MIEVNNLTKIYKSGKGIFDLSFTVQEGKVFGYLGPNGAGKTTTIRQLMGFTNANKGNCSINGMDCRTEAKNILKFVGYLPGETAFFDEMTGTQFLHFMKDMRKGKGKRRMHSLIERFELDPGPKIRKMSKGMKQKVGVVTAFMHDPSVYILDEPTSGLDPLMQKTFVDLILEERGRGKTILMSSHSFEEIERTSDRAGVIREGRLVAVEDVHSLKEKQRKVFVVTVSSPEEVEIIKSQLETGKIVGNQVEVMVSSNYDHFIKTLSRCRITNIDVVIQNLEQVLGSFVPVAIVIPLAIAVVAYTGGILLFKYRSLPL